jgi:hypothetical protein
MRYLLALVTSVLALAPSSATADDFSRPATFRELCGFEPAEAGVIVGSETARCLSEALVDFNLVLASKDPLHAKTNDFSSLTDGGTALWRGSCYDLTILKSLTSYQLPDGTWVHGYLQGPSLILKLGAKGWQPAPIARTRFVFVQKTAT